jgi:hypothetical protein
MPQIAWYDGYRKFTKRITVEMPGTFDAVHDEAKGRERSADALLAMARATTTHSKIVGPDGLTECNSGMWEDADGWFSLDAPSPESIEFGHLPSGVFDPARYGRVTKAPEGLYILHRAADLL